MNVLIVESPGKVKAINKYLGSNYKVLARYLLMALTLPGDSTIRTFI